MEGAGHSATPAGETAPAQAEASPQAAPEEHPIAAAEAAEAAPAPPVPAAPPAPAPSVDQIARWAIAEYEPLRLLSCYDGFDDGNVQAMAIAPDGKTFAVGGMRLTLWKLGDAQPRVDLMESVQPSFSPPVRAVAISSDGKWLAAGDQKGRLWIWNLTDTRQAVVDVEAHDSFVSQLAFSIGSEEIFTTSYSGEVKVWRAATGESIKTFQAAPQQIASMVSLPGNRIAVVGGEASLWDVERVQQEQLLAPLYVMASGLAVSHDQRRLFYGDNESRAHLRDLQDGAVDLVLPPSASGSLLADFSNSGKWIATANSDGTLRIHDATSGSLRQIIDGGLGETAAIGWLPNTELLLVASRGGRMRIWGAVEQAKAAGIEPLEMPPVDPIASDSRSPASSEQLGRIVDLRSLPRLPDARGELGQASTASYVTAAPQDEAEAFYRFLLGHAGWVEVPQSPVPQSGLQFTKDGCLLTAAFYASGVPGETGLNVYLAFAGNYDSRWLPRFPTIEKEHAYEFYSSSSYRPITSTGTPADLTDIEVSLLKQLHQDGWTGYSRLTASAAELQNMRMMSLLRGGMELSVMISPPADNPSAYAVQTSLSVARDSLPIPPDSGWIEFDAATDLMMVANTQMPLPKAIEFYDQQMAAQGWLARRAGRVTNETEGLAWSPYIRGQRDVTIHFQSTPEGHTRIIVGDPSSLSWQLKQPEETDPELEKNGIEVADWPLPEAAAAVDYDVDQKQLQFELPGVKPPVLAAQISAKLVTQGWQKADRGVASDEYVLASFTKGDAELDVRIRLVDAEDSAAMINGSGLLWNKALPSAPQRVSYGTWLARHGYAATLDRLDEFAAEMHGLNNAHDKLE